MELEHYMEKYRITQWKDGCIYRTESEGYGWFSDTVLKANRPGETNVVYGAASTEVALAQQTIRKAKEAPAQDA
jgi:hypothetical protein